MNREATIPTLSGARGMARFVAAAFGVGLFLGCTPRAKDDHGNAAPSANALVASAVPPTRPMDGREDLAWTVPADWRFYGAPIMSTEKGHFVAFPQWGDGGYEQVDIYVSLFRPTHGTTPEEWADDALARETDVFSRVDKQSVDVKPLPDGRRAVLVDVRGILRQSIPVSPREDKTVERPDRSRVIALVPTTGPPYRVVMYGRAELVERAREDFWQFVTSLHVRS
jgi:hypothetical protein